MKREALNVKEVELFKAVDRWVSKESERQGMTPDGHMKRRILGEEIVKAIRFPLMSQQEFLSAVFDSHILAIQEVGDIMKHYSGILASPLPFIQAARIDRTSAGHRCQRFKVSYVPGSLGGWNYSGRVDLKADGICFSVNTSIKLHGVQHFGSKGGEYSVLLEVKDITNSTNGSSVVKQSRSYSSIKHENDSYYSFDVLFDNPVCLVEGRMYEIVSVISGPQSWHGGVGKTSAECEGVQFTFTSSKNSPNNTSVRNGQFPALLFSKVCI